MDNKSFKKGDFVEIEDGETGEILMGWVGGYDEVTKEYYVDTVEGEEMDCQVEALTLLDENENPRKVRNSGEGTFPDPAKGNDIPTLPFNPALTGKRAHKIPGSEKRIIKHCIENIRTGIERYYETDEVADLEDVVNDCEGLKLQLEIMIKDHIKEANSPPGEEKLSTKYNSNSKFKGIFK